MFEDLQGARHQQLVGEDGLLVHLAVSVRVLQHADPVEGLARVPPRGIRQERQHLEHPQPAVRVEVHQDRRLDHRLRCDELEAVSRRQRERLHRFLGRERDRLLHLLLGRRPDVPRYLGRTLSGDDCGETDGARGCEHESDACSIHGCELTKTLNAVLCAWHPSCGPASGGRAGSASNQITRNTTAVRIA